MNGNRGQSNKENLPTLANARSQKDPARSFQMKELSINNNFAVPNDFPAFDSSDTKMVIHTLDKKEPHNPQHVPQFQANILSYLKLKDEQVSINPYYMSDQHDINPKMRSILVDWLVDVHIKFKLLSQTIFMSVNLIDRYLSCVQVTRQQLQLVGITTLMIICKYEEIYPPLLKDYVAVCDNAYTKEQILEMEGSIIQTLNFDVATTSCMTFLEAMQLKLRLEDRAFVFSRYILENSLFDLSSLKYNNLVLVAGAVFLVNKIFKRGNWKSTFEEKTSVSEVLAKQCAKDLFSTMQKMESVNLTALKRKFSIPDLFEVSKYRIEKAKNSN